MLQDSPYLFSWPVVTRSPGAGGFSDVPESILFVLTVNERSFQ